MKRLVMVALMVATSLALYSFRSTTETVNTKAEVVAVENYEMAEKNFTESAETFPDKFTKWRKSWVDYSSLESANISLKEMNDTLGKF